MSGRDPSLGDLLSSHRDAMLRLVQTRASGLLRLESAEDLVQGIHLRAIEVQDRFAYRGEREFIGWLTAITLQHIADRHRYWRALRRNAGKILHISDAASGSHTTSAVNPRASGSGPATRAGRRDDVAVAMEIFPKLFPRDRVLLEAVAEGLSIRQIARRLGIEEEAARKARLRALERFRLAVRAVARRP